MKTFAVKTKIFLPPQDELFTSLDTCAKKLIEEDVVCISSKVIAIAQGRTQKIKPEKEAGMTDKAQRRILIASEAAWYAESGLAMREGILVPFAGIDQSNGDGYFILWPRNPYQEAKNIWAYLRKKAKIKKLGVIITDSICMPLRHGVVGVALAHWGFNPFKDYRGQKDIFGRKMEISGVNIADCLATTAVLEMGEGSECTPITITRGFKNLQFSIKNFSKILSMPPNEDIFSPLLEKLNAR